MKEFAIMVLFNRLCKKFLICLWVFLIALNIFGCRKIERRKNSVESSILRDLSFALLHPCSLFEDLKGGDNGVVPRDGIEPPTRGFSVLCSTD
jgi:hypothetical protein